MAQKIPDWLVQMSNDPSLVSDTPTGDYQNRIDDARQQQAKDAEEARRNAILERVRRTAPNTPPPPPPPIDTTTNLRREHPPEDNVFVPQTDGPPSPPFDPDPSGPNREFEPATLEPPPMPSPIGPPLSAPDAVTPETQAMRDSLPMPEDSPVNDHLATDEVGLINHLAQITGLPPKVVATFALVGKQLRERELKDKNAGLPVGYNGDTAPPVLGPPPEGDTFPNGPVPPPTAPPPMTPPPSPMVQGGPPSPAPMPLEGPPQF